MKNQFELAGGSVIGREHLRVGKNNQDAYGWQVAESGAIAVVCDGCGSGKHSEVGAKLGTRMIIETMHRALKDDLDWTNDQVWQTIQQQWLTQLQDVAMILGGDRSQTIQDYLLFTIAGVVITPRLTAVFALGDGVIAINDQVMRLGPFANNAPPYLGYGLLNRQPMESNRLQLISFDSCSPQHIALAGIPERGARGAETAVKVLQVLPTAEVQSLLIGSDGVGDLIQGSEQFLPGRSEMVGDIAQFWQDERYFRNPDQVRRRLALINREMTTFDPQSQQCLRQSGLLPDDTTLIVIRRKEDTC